jgi:hypothetical protein
MCHNWCVGFSEVIQTSISDIIHADKRIQLLKLRILFLRSFFKLYERKSMIIFTSLTILYLALVFGWIVGKSTNDGTTVTGLIGIGTMCITLANLQYVFWIYASNQVY